MTIASLLQAYWDKLSEMTFDTWKAKVDQMFNRLDDSCWNRRYLPGHLQHAALTVLHSSFDIIGELTLKLNIRCLLVAIYEYMEHWSSSFACCAGFGQGAALNDDEMDIMEEEEDGSETTRPLASRSDDSRVPPREAQGCMSML